MNKFLKVECSGCGKSQVIFSRPSMVVKCLSCQNSIAEPTGGVGKISGKIKQILG